MPIDKNPKHWKLLIFYYNPDEPRLWYPPPMTLNYARTMAWAIVIPLVLLAIVAIIIRFHLGR